MKTPLLILLSMIALAPLPSHASEGHSHNEKAEKTEKTPNGGRLIHEVTPHAEFFVTPTRNVEIRFLDSGNVIAPAGQEVTVITGSRAQPTRLSFKVEGDRLVSTGPLPESKEGEALPIVLQIKTTPEAKAVTTRFTLNLAQCPTCVHAEYACTCAHAH